LPELDKPAYCDCPRADAGCTRYAERPQACRDYTCLWLDGEFDAALDRPDRLGVAFDVPSLIQEHPDYAGVHVICARELWPGARDGERAAFLLARLSRGMVVRLTAVGGRTQLVGPRELVARVVDRAQARGRALPRSGDAQSGAGARAKPG